VLTIPPADQREQAFLIELHDQLRGEQLRHAADVVRLVDVGGLRTEHGLTARSQVNGPACERRAHHGAGDR
jgi:hypothetical protein